MAKPIKEPAPEARERLLQAAAQLFAARGLHGTTTRDIAQEADINVSLISYYFGGKEALYETLLRDYAGLIEQRVMGIVSLTKGDKLTRDSFCRAIESLLSNMIDSHTENPAMKTILANEIHTGMPHSKALFDNVFDRFIREIVDLVTRAQELGYVKKDVNPLFFMTSMARSVDAYILTTKCPTRLTAQALKVPNDKAELLKQFKILFLEGALTS